LVNMVTTAKSREGRKSLNLYANNSVGMRRNVKMSDDFLDQMMTAVYEYQNSRRNCPETGELMPARTQRDSSEGIQRAIIRNAEKRKK
jgi:hypothetical protein